MHSYKTLGLVITINAVIMYLITYANIARIDHFYNNINRVYMALMMVAPMVILMLVAMRSMFPAKRLNIILHLAFAALLVISLLLVRTQTPVGNVQFLRSMIPHHSSAILMCREAAITDPQIVKLCEQIVKSQEEEIAEMKAILARY